MLPIRVHKDPAPSRWKYRFERLKLTPSYRFAMRFGLPFAVVLGVAWGLATNDGIQSAAAHTGSTLYSSVAERPELMLNEMQISGVSMHMRDAVLAAIDTQLPVSSLEINVRDIRRRIDQIEAVKRSEVRVIAGGVLQVEVQERAAALVWRTHEGLKLIDEEGILTGEIAARAERADLPLIAGAGANREVKEAVELLRTGALISHRIRGLVRVGERRWDIVLDHDQRIMLPEIEPAAALARVMALDAAEDIFGREVNVIDMRDGRRPILRVSAYAIEELRRLRSEAEGEKT